jgi:hypothetical protein
MVNDPRFGDPRFAFDSVADEYSVRPGYPALVFDILTCHCGLGDGSRVLEIGAGGGQATVALLDRGMRVQAIEPGHTFGQRLHTLTRRSDLEVFVGSFEDYEVAEASFEAVVSATAFIGFRPNVVSRRLYRPSGMRAGSRCGGPSLIIPSAPMTSIVF